LAGCQFDYGPHFFRIGIHYESDSTLTSMEPAASRLVVGMSATHRPTMLFAGQTAVTQAPPSHTVRFDGPPALVLFLVALALTVTSILRFVMLRRRARVATSAQGTAEAELRTLFAAMRDVVLVVDRDGRYTRVPVTDADVLYRPPPNVVGQRVRDVLPASAADVICTVSVQVIDTQLAVDAEFGIEFDSRVVWFAATASPFDAESALWVARNVTEAKVARDALAQSESRYRLLFDRNPCAMWVYDCDTAQIIEVNDAAVSQYGYGRAEFARMTLSDLRAPEEAARFAQIRKQMPADGVSVNIVKHRKKGGITIDAEVRGHPLGITGRNLRLAVSTDITERLAAEQVVREAESRATATSQMLQALIDVAPQAMIVMNSDWQITRWNDASEALFGWKAAEVIGGELPFIPQDQRSSIEARRRTLEYGAVERPTEAIRVRKDGKRIDVMLAISPLLDHDGRPTAFIAVYMDLTERKLLEEHVRQSQKMEAVGTLAGGVAHDFNNILTVISSYSDMLLMDDRYPDIRGDLEEISTAARRATGLTRQLLTFSRKAIVQLQPLDINTVVSDMQPMLRRLLMEHIEIIFKVTDDASIVTADLSQIEQVLLNLTVNAGDAMPDGGTLVVETQNVWLDEDYVETHVAVNPGPYVLLSVTDTGTGIGTETIQKIFEPFFTTKEVGRGTGLGLATVYAIVKQLAGHIWVYSEPLHGAVFKIYLPRDISLSPRQSLPIIAGRATATGTILLVEDDGAVRRATRRMLEKAGFTVIEAEDGEHGLSVASMYKGIIDVVVTDLMMPRMNGGDFAAALAETRPGSRVVYTSGYTDDSVLRQRLVDETHAFVQKPFTGDKLVRTIMALLNSTVAEGRLTVASV
jgi:PAS domain S-box-containing protein